MEPPPSEPMTLCIIKPDAVRKGSASDIETIIEDHNFAVRARMETTLSVAQAQTLLEDWKGSPEFEASVEHMSSGPIVVLALQRSNAVSKWLELLGPNDSVEAAAEAPNSVRARFGTDAVSNAAQGSASDAAALRELKLFFPNVFPREFAVALIAGRAAANAVPAFLITATVAEFLVISHRELELTEAQAAQYCAGQPSADSNILASGPCTAILFEKILATEDLGRLAERATSTASVMGGGSTALPETGDNTSLLGVAAGLSMALSAGAHIYTSQTPALARAEARLFFGDAVIKPTVSCTIIHPEVLDRAEQILAHIEANGFALLSAQLVTLDKAQAAKLSSTKYSSKVAETLIGHPSLALAFSRPCAISAMSNLIGPDSGKAQTEAPASLNAVFGSVDRSTVRIVCSGPATEQEASVDLKVLFPSLLETEMTLGLLLPDATPHVEAILAAANSEGLGVISRARATPDTLMHAAGPGPQQLSLQSNLTCPSVCSPPTGLEMTFTRERATDFLRLIGHAEPAAASPPVLGGAPSTTLGSIESTLDHMCSGPCTALALLGKGAVTQWSALLGPAVPAVAKVRCPTCLRARFGTDATRTVAFGSQSREAAVRELRFFFPKLSLGRASIEHSKEEVSKKLMPTLNKGLIALCRAKPAKPVEWLAQWLMENKANADA
jgi:nucleoside diphosphate kinase